jgi:hypothetical protein
MAYFLTKNTNLGKFWSVLQSKMLFYFMAIWYLLQPFGIFYGYFVHVSPFWYAVPEKSGSPAHNE